MDFFALQAAIAQRKDINLKKIEKAYHFAAKAHEGQKRKTGEEYVAHPLAVAIQLAEVGADEATIISALLHDTIEDTVVSFEDIKHEFGGAVALLVEGMTKFDKHSIYLQDGFDDKIETIRKWLMVMHKDLRIAIIKLIDRLDNLKTLYVFDNPQKRQRIAQETLAIYSKVAEWLSLYEIKYHIEELALPYALEADEYDRFIISQQNHQEKTERLLQQVASTYKEQFLKGPAEFLPLRVTPLRLSNNADTPAEIICLMPTEADCYQLLAFFHGGWRRKHGSFADYINTPRVNGYQALHTTVIFENADELTVRIMTNSMYEYSQKGVISFIFSGKPSPPLPWIEKLSELLKTDKEKSLEFWQGVESDLLEGFILVHGPGNKTVSLPSRSTYLDAAFAFLKKDAVLVEKITAGGREIPIRRRIEDGEKVDFVLADTPQVEYDWLEAVDNVTSIQMVKDALRNQDTEEKIKKGRQMLQQEFDKYNLGFVDEVSEKELLKACKELPITTGNDLFVKLAELQIFPEEVMARMAPKKVGLGGDTEKILRFGLDCEVARDRLPRFFEVIGSNFRQAKLEERPEGNTSLGIHLVIDASKSSVAQLLHNIRREAGMRVMGVMQQRGSRWLIIVVLAVLWGADPLFAHTLLDLAYTPAQLTFVRFFSVLVIMGFILGLRQMQKSQFSHDKKLPFLDYKLMLIGLSLFTVAFSTYQALLTTFPAHYNLVISSYLFLMAFNHFSTHLNFHSFRGKIPVIFAFLGYLYLFLDPTWSPSGKLWSLVAMVAFSVYYWLSNFYRHHNRVLSRYQYFQLYIGIYTLIFSLPFLFFVSWNDIDALLVLAGAVFTLIFIVIPYLLFPKSHQISSSLLHETMRVVLSIAITMIGQSLLLGQVPSRFAIIAFTLIAFGFTTYAMLTSPNHLDSSTR